MTAKWNLQLPSLNMTMSGAAVAEKVGEEAKGFPCWMLSTTLGLTIMIANAKSSTKKSLNSIRHV